MSPNPGRSIRTLHYMQGSRDTTTMQNSNLHSGIKPSVSAVKLAPVAMHTAVEHHGGARVGVGGVWAEGGG